MSKIGRPVEENPLDKKVTVRFRKEQLDWLNAYAEKYGITKSQAMQEAFELLKKQENK